ncbi:hypothetical protein [Laspinema olomoucense]|uniref:hypothetical protein n=1 Tax=Laspinema olomoucense TaxID=3231600 RepID=UPI0021BB1191|nr:hypothetical protein [Laspinema sp. D3d]MCT7975232.1 hypothetical protein [Laspinema sp. D3d]
MSGSEEDMKKQTEAILRKLSAEEQEILWKVIKAERDKLYMKKPIGINEDIEKAITEIIK